MAGLSRPLRYVGAVERCMEWRSELLEYHGIFSIRREEKREKREEREEMELIQSVAKLLSHLFHLYL